MQEDKQQQRAETDPNLDIPAEANRGKHINFLDAEEDNSTSAGSNSDNNTTERQKQWKEGLEEGERARRERDQ